MIQSYSDYKFYVKEDMKRNIKRDTCPWWLLALNVWYGNDTYRSFRYLKALRQYEYALNCLKNKGGLGRIICLYTKVRHHRMGARYGINIGPNIVGYGLYIPHLAGGGNLKL